MEIQLRKDHLIQNWLKTLVHSFIETKGAIQTLLSLVLISGCWITSRNYEIHLYLRTE